MKKIIRILFLLIIIVIIGYIWFGCVYHVNSNEIVLIKDTFTEEFSTLRTGYNFVWQGVIPGRIESVILTERFSEKFDIDVPIPPLEKLESEFYSVIARAQVIYKLDPNNMPVNADELWQGREGMHKKFNDHLKHSLREKLSKYFIPYYNRDGIIRDRKFIINGVKESAVEYCKNLGVKLVSMDISESFTLPDLQSYREGLAFYNEMRQLEKVNKRNMVALKNQLAREEKIKDGFIRKLEEISKLIQANPDLLKYIYIDRLGKNVKVIITSDRSGMPFKLDLDSKEDTLKNQKSEELNAPPEEIDNLRYRVE